MDDSKLVTNEKDSGKLSSPTLTKGQSDSNWSVSIKNVFLAWCKKYMGNPVYISATIAYMINVYRMNYFFDSAKDSIEETIERTGSPAR